MDCRADTALSLLMLNRTHTWLGHTATVEGKWNSYSNIYRRAHWFDKGTDAGDVPKLNVHPKKVMRCIWWSVHGIEYWEMLAQGLTVTADVYIEQLNNLKTNLENARPQQREVYFQHDSARLHIARTTKAKLMKFGWTILPHPPHSPELAPSVYHLFSYLQRHLDGQDFQTHDDIESYSSSSSRISLQRSGARSDLTLRKIIDAIGAYFK